MDESVMALIHDLRNKLTSVQTLIHMHMATDKRFIAEKELDEAILDVNKIWGICLACKKEGEDPK